MTITLGIFEAPMLRLIQISAIQANFRAAACKNPKPKTPDRKNRYRTRFRATLGCGQDAQCFGKSMKLQGPGLSNAVGFWALDQISQTKNCYKLQELHWKVQADSELLGWGSSKATSQAQQL